MTMVPYWWWYPYVPVLYVQYQSKVKTAALSHDAQDSRKTVGPFQAP